MEINDNKQLHLVLGASGAIGSAVLKELKKLTANVKAVERSKNIEGTETLHADLLNIESFKKVTEGATHLYLCVGLPYDSSVWQRDWPQIMKNAIAVCEMRSATLIFLDNVYMYGPPPLAVPFDENFSQNSTTIKGKIRKETADLMIQAMKTRKIKGVIGRSADFYGPKSVNSLLYVSFLQNMMAGKAPQIIATAGVKHTYAYTEDNGKALVALALDESAYGEVWHLPVGEAVTVEELLAYFNQELHTDFKASYLKGFMLSFLSLFIKPLGETREMRYQYETPYVMSDEKFRKHFPDFKVTSYQEGVKKMIESFQKSKV